MPELLDLELADDPNETHAAGDGVRVPLPSRGRSMKEILAERRARAPEKAPGASTTYSDKNGSGSMATRAKKRKADREDKGEDEGKNKGKGATAKKRKGKSAAEGSAA
ncbi:hypothetical protein FRC08_006893 [Ceratobasidium sp. 394]|nr:hypothetical protein FRC08_006893 [Ceratobasidium sp. 394]